MLPLGAQGPGFQMGHLFTNPPATSYRAGVAGRLLGPIGSSFYGTVVDSRPPMGDLGGLGLDLSLFRGGAPGLYFMGGVEGGFASGANDAFWGSWSAGVGMEASLPGGLSLAAEGRYRDLEDHRYHGVELGIRLGLNRGRGSGGGGGRRGSSPSTYGPPPAPKPEEVRGELDRSGVPADRATVISGVVQTALDAMGTPYRWGGEGETGFDCSGLIQYAFGQHGVTLPRRSVDQAREGAAIPRRFEALRPGDILTFTYAPSGERVSHVGLYVGDGRFIHSASQGVQLSLLSPEDPAGRWWYQRWLGARRVVP